MTKYILFALIPIFFGVPQADALRGDSIEVWHKWDKTNISISIISNDYTTIPRVDAIGDAIFNQNTLLIDDSLQHKGHKGNNSTYYLGWQAALDSIKNTTDAVPANIHMELTDKPKGDIVILLQKTSHPYGDTAKTQYFSGKIIITIFDIEKLGLGQLTTISRHELGHAFGITHSTAPEDLMHPVITTPYPYISQCNLRAIESLYTDNSGVTCLK